MAKAEPVTLSKIAETLSAHQHETAYNDLFNQIKTYPQHEKQAIKVAADLVNEAESSGEIPQQTAFGRLNLAHELVKAAAISGNEDFQKEAQNAYAAGQLAAVLLEQHIAGKA